MKSIKPVSKNLENEHKLSFLSVLIVFGIVALFTMGSINVLDVERLHQKE